MREGQRLAALTLHSRAAGSTEERILLRGAFARAYPPKDNGSSPPLNAARRSSHVLGSARRTSRRRWHLRRRGGASGDGLGGAPAAARAAGTFQFLAAAAWAHRQCALDATQHRPAHGQVAQLPIMRDDQRRSASCDHVLLPGSHLFHPALRPTSLFFHSWNV